MTRTEVRRRALRAAMAVTLGTAMLGCGTTVTGPAGQGNGGAPAAGGGGATASVDPSATTSTSGGAGGSDDSGTGGAAQASTSTSGGAAATKCGPLRSHWQAYEKCCDAVNWDFAQGCEAWGPPMPPAMDWEAKEVA